MNLTTTQKVLVGAATVWPIIYTFGFIAFVFSLMSSSANGDNTAVSEVAPIFLLHLFTILEGTFLMAFYVIHAFKNSQFEQSTRLLWAILIFVGNVIVMPIYFVLHVWPAQSDHA